MTRILVATLALLAVQDGAGRRAGELIEKLRSDKVDEREDAERKLKDLGKSAAGELERAARDADAEVATRGRSWRAWSS
jgi:hypothetical protein